LSDIKLLHVYGQEQWHDELIIVGNKEGLKILKDTIEKALEGDKEMNFTQSAPEAYVSVTDGEGYEIMVVRNDEDWKDKTWEKLTVPYTEGYAEERREGALAIHQIIGEARKRVTDEILESEE
jgi:hypothetical protein